MMKFNENMSPAEQQKWAKFHGVPATYRPDIAKLRRRLCSVAIGSRLQWAWKVNKELGGATVECLLHYGTFFAGPGIPVGGGLPQQCHQNSRKLAAKRAAYVHYRGMALVLTEGIWREHSWVMAPEGLLETTPIERDLYYGVPLPRGI